MAFAQRARITKDDVLDALASLSLVFAFVLIVVVHFFFLSNNVYLALKLSNVASIIVLFNVGYQWAKYAGKNKIRKGFGRVWIGFVISAVTTLLSG